jgi:hypothetical protein
LDSPSHTPYIIKTRSADFCLSGQVSQIMYNRYGIEKKPALWNRNYFFQFRFRLLKSYGSGSGFNFLKVMVPVPTFEKLRFLFRFQLHT